MKKLWKRVTKRSPSRSGEASPKSGSARGSVASLNIGYEVREKDLGKLHKAAWKGDLNKVKQLARKDASPLDRENRTPLHLACVQGHEHIVQELLEWKAKANIGDNQAKTPLMRAIEFQQEGCINLLLSYKVDIDTVDAHGDTALHMAVEGGNPSIVSMLIKNGASLNTKNKEGFAPLHLAVRNKHMEVCHLLLQEKADINVEDTHFRTPLMYACQDGSISLVKLLLEYNADTTHKDSKGWTADDCAVIQGHHACCQLISDYNLKTSRTTPLTSPRSSSQPSSMLSTPRDKIIIGLPVLDGGDEDSDNETESKVSGALGSDSWADSPDVSVADDSGRQRKEVSIVIDEDGGGVDDVDEEGKIAAPKINLSQFAKNIRISESDTDGDSVSGMSPRKQANIQLANVDSGTEAGHMKLSSPENTHSKLPRQVSLQSQTSGEDNSWADSPITPRKIVAPRVTLKKVQEITDIMESHAESDIQESAKNTQSLKIPEAKGNAGYVPSVSAHMAVSSLEDKRALMEEFGISDVDDISDMSEPTPPPPATLRFTMPTSEHIQEDSEWDSSVVSGMMSTPRPSILKTGNLNIKNKLEHTEAIILQQQQSQQVCSELAVSMDEKAVVLDSSKEEVDSNIQHQIMSDQHKTSATLESKSNSEDLEKTHDVTNVVPSLTKTAAVVEGGMIAPDEGIKEDSGSDWDSEAEELPSDNAAAHGSIASANQVSANKPQLIVHGHVQAHEICHPLVDSDDDTETISSWEKERKSIKSAREMFSSLSRDNVLLEETSKNPVEGFHQQLSYQHEENGNISDKSMTEQEVDNEEQINEINDFISRTQTDGGFWHNDMGKQWQGETLEDIDKKWELNEEEIKEQLTHGMVFIQNPDSPTDAIDSVLYQQQELARIDEQFEQERIERVKREEEENRHRKEDKEARQPKEKEWIKIDDQESSPWMLKSGSLMSSLQPSISVRSQPALSSVCSNIGGSATQEIKQRLQVIPTVPVPATFSLYSDLEDDDESLLSDTPVKDRPSMAKFSQPGRSLYKAHIPLDDDALSYTSTEFEEPVHSTPLYGRERDILSNVSLSDPNSLLKVQEYVRETRSALEQERNRRFALESKLSLYNKEKDDMIQKLESMSHQKSTLEEIKLELEAKIRSLEYNITEETEKCKNAEVLLAKTKEQLARKESQFSSELEAKQKAELTLRNVQIEMRTMANTVKELEEAKQELERQLSHANSIRVLQEQISDDQQKLFLKQQQQRSMDEDFYDSSLEFNGDSNKLQAELYAIKMEMDRQRSRFKDEMSLRGAENEELMSKVEELRNDIKLNEEALAHATMQYNIQLSTMRMEISTANSVTEREKAAKEKLETEVETLKNRLTSSNQEMDNATRSRNEIERELQREKEHFNREIDRKNDEIAALKENVQLLNVRLTAGDSKLSLLENELHVANTSLMEKTSNLQQLQQELERCKISNMSLDENYKDQNSKLQAKVDSLQDKYDLDWRTVLSSLNRLSQYQHETLSLHQQIESLQRNMADHVGFDANEKLNNILTNLQADHDRAKANLEDKNSSLLEQVARLKEEARVSETCRVTVEQNLRRLQDEQNELLKKFLQMEASLQMSLKTREQLEQEKVHLKMELETLQQRYQTTHDQSVEARARLSELVDRLEKAENSSAYSHQQLVNTSANMHGLVKSKLEQDESFQQLQINNAKLEAELQYEKQRADMLYQDLQDSQKVRSSLEALCANLKSTTAHLEDKIGVETAARVMYEAEAHDHKTLYDLEIKSRSKLGLRLADLERSKQSSESQLMEEKKRATLANEERRSLEARLEAEIVKNQQLQKDVETLKTHLKSTKHKIKMAGTAIQDSAQSGPDDTLTKIHTDIKVKDICQPAKIQFAESSGDLRSELEAKYRKELNRQLEDINRFLDSQSQLRDRLDTSRTEVEVRLKSDKRRLEEDIHNLRVRLEQAMSQTETAEMEAKRFRELYESEMKWRIRVSDQLQLATERSCNLKSKLNNERIHRNHLADSIGTFNSNIVSNSSFDVSKVNDELSNKIKAELDRSIAQHLEAAPHDNKPLLRPMTDPVRLTSSLAQSSHEYMDLLTRKYCV